MPRIGRYVTVLPLSARADALVLAGLGSIDQLSILFFDREMRILAVHGGAVARHGYLPERIIGRRAPDVLPASAWVHYGPLYTRALTGETVTVELETEDGTAVYETTFQPVRQDGELIGGMATSRDVTEQRFAERELARTNSLLQGVLDNSPTAIYARDLEGRWLVANAETGRVTGLDPSELLGRPLEDTYPPKTAAILRGHDAEVLAATAGRSFDVELPGPTGEGPRHWWTMKFPISDERGVVGVGGMSLDVTERDQAVRELAAARELFEAAFENAPVGKVLSRLQADGTSVVTRCNRAFAAMLGLDAEQLIGVSSPTDLMHPEDLPERDRMMGELMAGRPVSGDIRFRHADGSDVWAHVAPAIVGSADGETLVILQALDITERKHLETRLKSLADHDALTGIFSRQRFDEELRREVARVSRHGTVGCLLLIDLDGFKQVNDSFGHAVGDALLRRVADGLKGVLRAEDTLARLGGDEFAVILPSTDLEGANTVAVQLADVIRAARVVVSEAEFAYVTASIGVAGISTSSAEGVLAAADLAMYQAKDAGKDDVTVDDSDAQ